MCRHYLALLASITLIPLQAGIGEAGTYRVPLGFSQVQTAIDHCSPGDTVLVAPGVYSGVGNIDLSFNGVDLLLLSEAGAQATTIDCQGQGRAILFVNGETANSVVGGQFGGMGGRTLSLFVLQS